MKRTGNEESDLKASSGRAGVRTIAESLGISIATVDRALHDRPDVNPMTKARVLKTAEALGYRPNLAARFLRSHTKLRIAAVIPRELASFFNELRKGIAQAAAQFSALGLEVEYYDYPSMGVGEVEAVERALVSHPKGMIVVPGARSLKPLIRKASREKIPVVCSNSDMPGTSRLTAVSMDPIFGGASAAELIGRFTNGRGRVALITGAMENDLHRRQVESFRSTLAEMFPAMRIAAVIEAHSDEQEAYQGTLAAVPPDGQLSGVYVTSANSPGVVRALRARGLLGSVTIVATDLFPQLAKFIQSGKVAATIWQRPRSQGRIALESLFRFLADGICPPTVVELTPHIVMRSNLKRFMETVASTETGGSIPAPEGDGGYGQSAREGR